MAAVDDCITAVITSPAATSVSAPSIPGHHPTPGPARTAGRSAGCRRSASPAIPCCRVVSPNSTRPNPASAAPAPETRPPARSLTSAPTKIIGNAAAVSETRTPMSATSQPVPVVPTLAPKTRPSPCGNVSKPALTRPMVVIVVALDDWTRSVTSAPQKEPRSGVDAALPSTVRSAEPANAFRPSVMTVMPRRKRPTPPRTEIAVDMRPPECGGFDVPISSPRVRLGTSNPKAALESLKWLVSFSIPTFVRSALQSDTNVGIGTLAERRSGFAAEGGTRRLQLPLLLCVDRRIGEVEFLHGVHDGGGDDQPSKPLVVGRHDVPGCALRCGGPNCFLEGVHVVAPEAALVHVGGREFPVFVRLVEALHEALLLLLARQMQKELENDRPLPGEVILEARDIEQPLVPDALAHELRRQLLLLQDILVYTHHEDLLVVGSVENPDPPPLGQALDVAPEKIVVEVLRRGLLERKDLAALRIHPRHHVLDGPVLAGRVHRLEHQEQRPAPLGIKDVLLLGEQTVPRCSRSAASPLSSRRPRVSPGSKSASLKPLPCVMRNGRRYFSMRSMISCLGMANTLFAIPIDCPRTRRSHNFSAGALRTSGSKAAAE